MAPGTERILNMPKSSLRAAALPFAWAVLSFTVESLSNIRRALYRMAGPVQYMGVNHRGGDIGMSQEFLDRPDVIVGVRGTLLGF